MKEHELRETTLDRIYRPAFKSLISVIGNKRLLSYSVRDVEEFKAVRAKTCSPHTVNIEFRTLRAAFNCAVKWEIIADSPFMKSKQLKIPERTPQHFTKEEFLKFHSAVTEPILKELFLLAVLTGVRQGEILHLQWSQVDFERKLIHITNSDSFTTKSGRCRTIAISEAALELLCRIRQRRDGSTYVFNRQGEKLTQSYVEHKFKKYLREVGLNDKLNFHSLRHTFATLLIEQSASIYELQKLLGHYDIKTTQMYTHLSASELHATVNKISLGNLDSDADATC
jgi:site-specific recombinase XerD